ncbi:MAG: hypothetical protein ACXAD7_15380 [Candidatus Kariarchaeaceae archaeon]|jgi:hypothetical protein
MGNYKLFTIIQSIAILLVGISVFDYGYAVAENILTSDGIGFNDALFSEDGSEWWSMVVFWGYGFLIVGIVQLLKALGD